MFEDALRGLRKLQRRAQQLDGHHEVGFADLFPDEFMLRSTDFPSIASLVEASGYSIESQEDFEAIPEAEWDRLIQDRTRFESWEGMLRAATQEWALRQLDL
jgi:hypothetical protein